MNKYREANKAHFHELFGSPRIKKSFQRGNKSHKKCLEEKWQRIYQRYQKLEDNGTVSQNSQGK